MIYVADMAILMSNFDNCDNIFKTCYSKNKHHIGVVHVPSFHLSARSSSFFVHFFFAFMVNLFMDHPIPVQGKGTDDHLLPLGDWLEILCRTQNLSYDILRIPSSPHLFRR